MSKKQLEPLNPSTLQAIDRFHAARMDSVIFDQDALALHAEQYPEMQLDADPTAVSDMRDRLLSLPMIHRTSHPNFGGADHHDQIKPTSELGFRPQGGNTYSLDRGMGLHQFTFLTWGGLEGEDDFLRGTRYAVLLDPRVILRMPGTIATPHDVATHVSQDMLHAEVMRNIPLPRSRRVANAVGEAFDALKGAKTGVKRSLGEAALRVSTSVTYHKTRLTQGERKAQRAAREVERTWDRKDRKQTSLERRADRKRDRERRDKDRAATRFERRERHIRYGEESERVIKNYFDKVVGGPDWLEIEARRLAGMVEGGEFPSDRIPLTANTLGEIKVHGSIPKEAVIGVIDLHDKTAVEAYRKVVSALGFAVERPKGMRRAAAKQMGHTTMQIIDDSLHL